MTDRPRLRQPDTLSEAVLPAAFGAGKRLYGLAVCCGKGTEGAVRAFCNPSRDRHGAPVARQAQAAQNVTLQRSTRFARRRRKDASCHQRSAPQTL